MSIINFAKPPDGREFIYSWWSRQGPWVIGQRVTLHTNRDKALMWPAFTCFKQATGALWREWGCLHLSVCALGFRLSARISFGVKASGVPASLAARWNMATRKKRGAA